MEEMLSEEIVENISYLDMIPTYQEIINTNDNNMIEEIIEKKFYECLKDKNNEIAQSLKYYFKQFYLAKLCEVFNIQSLTYNGFHQMILYGNEDDVDELIMDFLILHKNTIGIKEADIDDIMILEKTSFDEAKNLLNNREVNLVLTYQDYDPMQEVAYFLLEYDKNHEKDEKADIQLPQCLNELRLNQYCGKCKKCKFPYL